ncbi:MAG: hypothetical protein KGJ86_11610 [Chloroflexota bacterium]|nr:hypothetical protein [Chloroflexota bacterium]
MAESWVYQADHVVHVVGALGISAAYTLEAVGLVGLRLSKTAEEARLWFRTRHWVLFLGPPSLAVVLASGLYLTVVAWGPAGWILVALGGLVATAVIGGVLTGIPMARLGPLIEKAVGPLSDEAWRAVRTPLMTISMATRVTITVAIVALMVLKPTLLASLLAIGLALVSGVPLGLAFGSGQNRPGTAKPLKE